MNDLTFDGVTRLKVKLFFIAISFILSIQACTATGVLFF